MKKYLVYPGKVISKHDGNVHHISARHLIDLYGVNPDECIVVRSDRDLVGIREGEYKVLAPLYNGNYDDVIISIG